MKQIIIDIDTDGSTTITTKGFRGAECLKETLALEAALGVKISDEKTPEFNQTATQTNVARVRG
jgi:hypothetical protein